MSSQIYLGFLAEDKTVPGVVKYLFWMSGVFFLGLVLMVWFMRRRERAILVSFLFPVIFAFVLLMTPDINVNHKYIMISYAFLTIFWAWAVCSLWKGAVRDTENYGKDTGNSIGDISECDRDL